MTVLKEFDPGTFERRNYTCKGYKTLPFGCLWQVQNLRLPHPLLL